MPLQVGIQEDFRGVLFNHITVALLILSYNFSIFQFSLIALIVCTVMNVIGMPNDGVYPIQVVTQDADMVENINLNG